MEKKSEEILAELYRNGVLAMQSIEDILPAADEATKAELEREYGEYERKLAKDCFAREVCVKDVRYAAKDVIEISYAEDGKDKTLRFNVRKGKILNAQ